MPMRKILLFAIIWLLVNLLQSHFTEITADEAYYWVFSRFLDWGYNAHPPMVALLIRLGTFIGDSEIFVRLFSSLLGAGTVFIVLYMMKDRTKELNLAMLLMLSIPLLHLHGAGWLATPDTPVVFFTALFFFMYQQYLKHDSFGVSAMLAITIALMFYSKYHGFLIVGFTVLSNLQLLRKRSFWMVFVIAALLYFPHIIYQIRHDFDTFYSQLFDRSSYFEPAHVFNYIGVQILQLGPFTGFVVLILGIRKRAENSFERALKFSFAGLFLFFLFSCVRGHVEAHWTAAAYIPLLLFALPEVTALEGYRKYLKPLAFVSIILILIIRVSLIIRMDIIPDKVNDLFHSKEEVMHKLEEIAEGEPVVFTNSYSDASLYWYFTGIPSFSYDNYSYQRTQYDVWNSESDFQGQRVLYVRKTSFPGCDTLRHYSRRYIYHFTDHFCSYNRVDLEPLNLKDEYVAGEKAEITLMFQNTSNDTICFGCNCSHKPHIKYAYYYGSSISKRKTYLADASGAMPDLMPYSSGHYKVVIQVPDIPGETRIQFSIGSGDLFPGINSRPMKLTILSGSDSD